MFAWFGMTPVKKNEPSILWESAKTDCDFDPADSPSRVEWCEVSVDLSDSCSIPD